MDIDCMGGGWGGGGGGGGGEECVAIQLVLTGAVQRT